jgi:hypothetical protein
LFFSVLDADSIFADNNQMPFSTYDRELDVQFIWNCAVIRHGAWWYHACTIVNLNGKYLTPGSSSGEGHWHYEFDNYFTSKTSSMMMRRN